MDAPSPRDPVGPRRRLPQPLETVLLASTACLLAAVAWPIAKSGFMGPGSEPGESSAVAVETSSPTETPATKPAGEASIQVALLLDTSSSMDGLIDQARTRLWSVVQALDGATLHGGRPKLEIAIYEYGNSGLSAEDGFIRQVLPFSHELDTVSEALFSLSTRGGSEHAGEVIARSVDELQWGSGQGVLRVMYVAGNEPFSQGPVDFRGAIEAARGKGVVVNTVHCGGALGPESDWAQGAALGGGRFLAIDHNHVETYVAAPQDDEIAKLGVAINGTYIRYGTRGSWGMGNIVAQDNNMEASKSRDNVVTRALSKGSRYYRNDSWDLVDALDGDTTLEEIDRETLPAELQTLDEGELRAHVDEQKQERGRIQKRLGELAAERTAWLTENAEKPGDPDALDDAIIASIREQAVAAGFEL